MNNTSSFSFKLGADLSRHYIKIHYPANWTELSGQERLEIAKEVSFALGPYLAFEATTWHEILTWYGFKCMYVYTEFPSAFSWEDSYSNLLGAVIAVTAMHDKNHSYNEALTIAFDKELEKLGVQPAYFAKSATDRMKGKWFSGGGLFFVDIKKRNFDVGLDDDFITPTLLEGISEYEFIGATSYRVPNLDVLANYGFSAKIETKPAEWEKDKIFKIAFGKNSKRRIELAVYLARIMDDIETEAAEKYGYEAKTHISKFTQTQTGEGSL
jgi:hypothetical protein